MPTEYTGTLSRDGKWIARDDGDECAKCGYIAALTKRHKCAPVAKPPKADGRLTITLAPAERDDITLGLRQWADVLDEGTADRLLTRRRRIKAALLRDLADRLSMAEHPELVGLSR